MLSKQFNVILLCLLLLIACNNAEPQSASSLDNGSAKQVSDKKTKRLPVNFDRNNLSVSGVSSGAYMAQQLHFAHSDRFIGVGVVAGGPYHCANGSLAKALSRCAGSTDESLSVSSLVKSIREAAASGAIADPDNLVNDRVWGFHGTLDTTVGADVSALATELYRQFIGEDKVHYIDNVVANHHLPTEKNGHACEVSEAPYLGSCNLDVAGEILKHIYPDLQSSQPDRETAGKLHRLSRSDYGEVLRDNGLHDEFYLYVPNSCATGKKQCKLHLFLHGCAQSSEKIGTALIDKAGFHRWADANELVMLYPQIESSLTNPHGCWDWWGYSGPRYAYRDGAQIRGIMAIIDSADHGIH